MVPAAAELTLRAVFSADAAEPYLAYDAQHARLVERAETLEVDWYTNAGLLSARTTQVDKQTTEVRWRTPVHAGPAQLWLVVRDDRGGIATQTVALSIRE